MTRGKLLIIGTAAAMVLLLASCGPRWLLGPSLAAIQVTRRDLVQTLVLNGKVLAPRRVNLGTQLAGVVARRLVDEGARVKAGQVLVQLEDAETRAQVAQAQANLAQVREVADPAGTAGLRQAEATLLQADLAHRRAERLFKEGVLAASQVEETRKALEVAEAALANATAQARSAQGGAALRTALAALALARARLDQMTVRAPAEGVILSRAVEMGDVVSPGKVLMTMALDEPLQLLVQPDEKHLAHLALGQRALASSDAFPTDRFEARVSYLAPMVDALRGTVDVKLAVPAPPATLRADMTVSVEIEQGRGTQTLTVPVAAVRGLPDRPHVVVRRHGRAERVDVHLGYRGEREVEILKGLSAGDVVFLDAAARPGQKARARF